MVGSINYSSAVKFQISQLPPAGITDPVLAAAFLQVYKAIQQLILLTTPGNNGGTTIAVITSEAVAYGAPVNLYSNSGVLTARNANSSISGRAAIGFCTSTAGISSGSTGYIDLASCIINNLSGLALGSLYYLAPSSGGIQVTPDTTSGHIEQFVGQALSTTSLLVKLGSWLQH